MKKRPAFLYPLGILIIVTIALIVINALKNVNNDKEKKEEVKEKYEIDYKANQTIRVKMTNTNEVVAMDINDYLRGVLPAEMPPSYNMEALKAQAIVARTYTYRKMQAGGDGDGIDMCDYFGHCQAFYNKNKLFEIWRRRYNEETINEYWKKVNQAVTETQNEVITYKGQIVKAFFHASSPIKTENINQIWGGENLPYLVSVESKESETYANRNSTVKLSFEDTAKKLKDADLSRKSLDEECVKNACINEYTTSGRVKNVKFGEYIISAEKLRVILGLKSTNFTIQIEDNNIVFNVIGYGHGVGLSQVGADFYAKEGLGYKDIINHYFTDVDIVKLN